MSYNGPFQWIGLHNTIESQSQSLAIPIPINTCHTIIQESGVVGGQSRNKYEPDDLDDHKERWKWGGKWKQKEW